MSSPADRTEPERFLLLVYEVPANPSRTRVAVWRDLKRLGALYLQQAVCVVPDRPPIRAALENVRQRISELDGTSIAATLADLEPADRAQIVDGFLAGSGKEYAEIIEECRTKFLKEIEFERFRENYTFEEAEEIRQDLEKLRRWMAKVVERDWLGAPGRAEAEAEIATCEQLLEDFEADVYQRSHEAG